MLSFSKDVDVVCRIGNECSFFVLVLPLIKTLFKLMKITSTVSTNLSSLGHSTLEIFGFFLIRNNVFLSIRKWHFGSKNTEDFVGCPQ